jgi:hypothetical protein
MNINRITKELEHGYNKRLSQNHVKQYHNYPYDSGVNKVKWINKQG